MRFLMMLLVFVLAACSKEPEKTENINNEPVVTQPKHTEFKGSLVESWANSPNAFYSELVNGRSQFTDNQEFIEANRVRQTITNTDGTLIAENLWHKNNEDWRCYSATLTYSSSIDMDSMQVVLRWPYRFEHGDVIFKNMSTKTNVSLPSGATMETRKQGHETTFKIE